MYNKASLKAEEFICHEEIEETLAYAEANKDNLALIDEIIAKAKLRKGLTHREASVLLACENEEKIQEVYDLAEQIKKDFYRNVCTIVSVQLLYQWMCVLPVPWKK